MLPEPSGYVISRFLAYFPGWLIRYYFRSDKIAKLVDIDLRSNRPIIINVDVPEISLYFYLNNRSPFNLTLDRLLIDLWVGQPILKGAILRRYVIPKGESINDIYFSCSLTSQQQNQIKQHCKNQLLSIPVSLTITAYLESKVGIICLDNQRTDRSDVPCKVV